MQFRGKAIENSFEDNLVVWLFKKLKIKRDPKEARLSLLAVLLLIFYLPLVVLTLIDGTFWTGDLHTSFITTFDTQARLLISMPIFLLAGKLINERLKRVLMHFMNSGVIPEGEGARFENIIIRNLGFLRSGFPDLVLLVISCIQSYLVFEIKSQDGALLSWQITETGAYSMAGWWNSFISSPFVLFLFYRWLFRIFIWGKILYQTSRLDLTLFPVHPDLAGGLGFLGESIRYFSPITFAISATAAGNMVVYTLNEGLHMIDFRWVTLGYFVFITLLVTLPLLSFIPKMIRAREDGMFENYVFSNALYRVFRGELSKPFYKVGEEDLRLPYYSSAEDLSAVVERGLKMRIIPFGLKDLIPLWITAAIPFLSVVLIDMPLSELLGSVFNLLV